MATAKRKSSSKKTAHNKVQQQWGSVVKKLSLQQKKFQDKIKAIKKDVDKKVAEAEAAIVKIASSLKSMPTAKKSPARSKAKRISGMKAKSSSRRIATKSKRSSRKSKAA